MAAVGELLLFFPELMLSHKVFKMDAKLGGGYGERYDERQVVGYWSWRKGGEMGIEGDLRSENHQAIFWERADAENPAQEGDYIEKDGDIYLVKDDDEFVFEGNFIKCIMQRVEAVTDTQTTNTEVAVNVAGDYE